MYTIVGADQKTYGPVTAEQMRQWIAQGRVNAQTQVLVEGANEWKVLAAYPEFSSLLRTMAPIRSSGSSREAALQAVKGPAIALIVTAIIDLLLAGLGLLMNVLKLAGVNTGLNSDGEMSKLFSSAGGWMEIVGDLVAATVAVLIVMGALKMKALVNRPYAIAVSILALLPCVSPCCFVGVPIGIWALVVLNKPEVKSHFT